MANAGRKTQARFGELLSAPGGLSDNLAAAMEAEAIVAPEISERQIAMVNVAAEIRERAQTVDYPALQIYCERIQNTLREKFRTFSGTASMAAEVRVSQDRLEGIEQVTQLYTDAVTRVLDQRRGDWGGGMFYTGGYSVDFGPVKKGGKNFLQTAVVRFDVIVSAD